MPDAGNAPLVAAAIKMLSSKPVDLPGDEFLPEYRDSYCLRWVRQVVQSVYGPVAFEAQFRDPRDADGRWTAREAAVDFARAGYQIVGGPKLPGDLLFKGDSGDGHVGILLQGNWVAENSTVHWNRSGRRDARGKRALADFGQVQWVIRLRPPAVKQPARNLVTLPLGKTCQYRMIDGTAWVPLRPVAEALGAEVDADALPTIVVKRGPS